MRARYRKQKHAMEYIGAHGNEAFSYGGTINLYPICRKSVNAERKLSRTVAVMITIN